MEGKTIEGVLDLLERYPIDKGLSLIRGSWWWAEFNVSGLRVWSDVGLGLRAEVWTNCGGSCAIDEPALP